MPSAGDKVRASDLMHRLTETTRGTNLGSAVTADTALACDAAFTLSRTRRVRVEFLGAFACVSAPSATNSILVVLRKNATGAAIATTDTAVVISGMVGALAECSIWFDDLLTAGTYAYGPTLSGSGTTGNLNVSAGNPARITVWDMGDV